jgi:hypothetical protein
MQRERRIMPDKQRPKGDAPKTLAADARVTLPTVSFARGFADLLDVAAPQARITVASPGSPTAVGFARTGRALREALTSFGKMKS